MFSETRDWFVRQLGFGAGAVLSAVGSPLDVSRFFQADLPHAKNSEDRWITDLIGPGAIETETTSAPAPQ